ncbi:MAG TPA: PD-(D/E)XK nuclease family protein, partial [Acidimicrobiales bacterium]
LQLDPEFAALELAEDQARAFRAEAASLLRRYFAIEDPNQVRAIGVELLLEANLGDLRLRGIIDRLDLDADGELVVTDYKTGRVPPTGYEQRRLGGVHFYAYLCERVLGRRPARVQLLYLSEPLVISTVPSEQSVRGLERQARAIWSAVRLACEREDFRPRPSPLCASCGFHAYCPAMGGDVALVPRPAVPMAGAGAGTGTGSGAGTPR